MQFEWDEQKARTNFVKHRVLFETATLVFDDPYAVTRSDIFHSDEEQRFITFRFGGSANDFVCCAYLQAGERERINPHHFGPAC